MKIVDTVRTDRLELRGGGGPMMLFGLPFLTVGIAAWLVAFGVIPLDGDVPVPVALLFGVAFGGVGAGFVFGRRGCVIDRQRGTLERWWGLLVPLRRTSTSLTGITKVTIAKEIRRSDKSTYTVYPVRLVGGEAPASLGEARSYDQSRALAERLAAFLSLPLGDSTAGEEVVRDARHLDESLRERLRRTGAAPAFPPEPEGSRCQLFRKGDQVMVEFPPVPANPLLLLLVPFAIFGVITMTILTAALGGSDLPAVIRFGIIPAFLLAMVAAAFALRKASKRTVGPTRIVVSPTEGLRAEWGARGGRAQAIPLDELEELVLQRGDPTMAAQLAHMPAFLRTLVVATGRAGTGIVARSDTVTLAIGGHLTPAELQFVHDVIEYVVAS